MTHPNRADDEVAEVAGNMATFALIFSAELLKAAGKHDRRLRAEALVKVFATWPKICRRMAALEALAPASAAAGTEEDARVYEVVQAIEARKLAQAD